jgi:hypothetical protein
VIPETIDPDSLLTSTQVGNLLQVNPSSVKKCVNDGHIIAFRTPGDTGASRADCVPLMRTRFRCRAVQNAGAVDRRR